LRFTSIFFFLFYHLIFFSSYAQDNQKENRQNYFVRRQEFSLGNENFTRKNTINGGNYAYLQYFYQVSRIVSIGGKVITDIVPNTFDDNMLAFNLRYNSNINKNYQTHITLTYLQNFKKFDEHHQYLGLRFAWLSYLDDENNGEFRFELLPVSFFYPLEGGKVSLSYEFLAISIRL